jgi:hypothetical protein
MLISLAGKKGRGHRSGSPNNCNMTFCPVLPDALASAV